jgi:outer membrane autotransporter protein
VALLAAACAVPAVAQDATWTGAAPFPLPNDNWNVPQNWSTSAIPSGVASFGTIVPPVPSAVIVHSTTFIETIRFDGTTAYSINITAGCGCGELFVTGTGVVNNSGVLQTFNVANGGLLNFLNSSTITGNVLINNTDGFVVFGNLAGGGTDTASAGSATIINTGSVFPFGTFFLSNSNAGTAQITNQALGVTFFAEQSSAANSTITNVDGGQTVFGSPFGGGTDTATAGNAYIIADGALQTNGVATVMFFAFTTAGNATIDVRNGAYVGFADNSTGGNARFITDSDLNSTVNFSQTYGPGGLGEITAGSIEGGGTFIIGSNNLIVGSNNLSTTVSGEIDVCSCGALTKIGSGTLVLNADLSFFYGSLFVNGGTVVVNSDMSAATQAVAYAGGTLAGAGILPTTFINGGTLSPGDGTTGNIAALTIMDQVTFTKDGTYRVDVAPGGPGPVLGLADYTLINSSGTASTLAGIVNAVGMGGTGYKVGTIYPILVGPDGFNGRFDRLFVSGSFGSTRPIITYNDPLNPQWVNIELIQGEVSSQLTSAKTYNQIEVARALDNALLKGADFGPFTPLYNLTGDTFLKALDQISGEANTGIFQSVYQSVSNFISSMLNPFNNGRSLFGPATPYAPEDDDVDAYAAKRKISRQAQQAMAAAMPVKAASARDNRYAVWANGYGGQTSIDGNGVVGSHQTNVRGYGFAAGLDFRVAPEALVGFAMAGGGSSWGLSGRTDNFHAGVYGSLRYGPAYLSAAMAYGHHWVSTKRNVVMPGFATLESDYDANSFGGRIEAGYRYGLGSFGLTPYAALQASVVRLSGYSENATAGNNAFALQYGSQSDNLFRTELGSWFDHSRVIPGGVLTLRARAAWAHDEGANRSMTGAFPFLPGSTFLVQGANPGNNLALLSAGAEWRYWSGWSFAARFDSELSDRSRGYGGTGVVRYVW